MTFENIIVDYNALRTMGTGNLEGEETETRFVIYPLDRFEIVIELGPDNEFLGVREIRLNQDFLNHEQELATLEYVDVDESYLDE